MRQENQRVALRIGTFLLPILLGNVFCPFAAWGQAHESVANRGLQAQIDVTVHDSSGEILSVPADVKLYFNGMPCDEGLTSTGRISFSKSNLGKFTVAAEATGYEPGQSDLNVAEPNRFEVTLYLRRKPSASSIAGAAGNPILTPKAQESLSRGMRALKEGNLTQAQKALDEAIKRAPNNPNVLYLQGLLDLRKHDWIKAQSALEKATQMEPDSARAWAALGMALCNQKKYAEAIAPLEQSVQLDPTTGWETRWSLAEAYYRGGRYEDAVKVAQQAQVESHGQVPQVDLLVAQALAAVGRYEESAQVLRELLKNHRDCPEAATAQRYLERLTADGKIR